MIYAGRPKLNFYIELRLHLIQGTTLRCHQQFCFLSFPIHKERLIKYDRNTNMRINIIFGYVLAKG